MKATASHTELLRREQGAAYQQESRNQKRRPVPTTTDYAETRVRWKRRAEAIPFEDSNHACVRAFSHATVLKPNWDVILDAS